MDTLIKKRKTRLIVKNSYENILLSICDIALLYLENRIVFVIDENSKKYQINKSLSEIEEELDPKIFFRANRGHIINVNYVKGFTDFERNKLKVYLTVNHPGISITISRQTAPFFKTWICES